MTDEVAAAAVLPPKIPDALKAAWKTFTSQAAILVVSFAIFLGSGVAFSLFLHLIAGSLGPFLAFLLSTASILPSLLLLPGLYAIALKATRGQRPDVADLFVMFKDRFIHHLGMLLLQVCGALVCIVGVWVSQAMFIPGSFLVLDRKLDWDGALETCVEQVKPRIVNWILFNIAVFLVGFAGFFFCVVGALVTGPVALCAWAYAYEHSFAKPRA
jgi:hypothetical protein